MQWMFWKHAPQKESSRMETRSKPRRIRAKARANSDSSEPYLAAWKEQMLVKTITSLYLLCTRKRLTRLSMLMQEWRHSKYQSEQLQLWCHFQEFLLYPLGKQRLEAGRAPNVLDSQLFVPLITMDILLIRGEKLNWKKIQTSRHISLWKNWEFL